MYVVSAVSTKGNDIKMYEEELASLENENRILIEKVASNSSLSKIRERALALGMVELSSSDFLTPLSKAQADTKRFFQ